MPSDYIYVAVFLLGGLAFGGGTLAASGAVPKRLKVRYPDPEKLSTYECG